MQTQRTHPNSRTRRHACQILAATFLVFTGCTDTPTGLEQNDGVLPGGASFHHSSATDFTVIDLGDYNGATWAAWGINNAGQVIGSSPLNTLQRAYLWQDGTIIDLGTLGGSQSSAHAINEAGQVVGITTKADGGLAAFLWEEGVGMRDLGVGEAFAINDAGQVVGRDGSRAFLWEDGVGMRDLGTLGGSTGVAYGINNSGQVVGATSTASGATRAFLWEDDGSPTGTMTDLGTLGGSTSVAYGINDAGQVVGISQANAGGDYRAFLWEDGVGMQDITFYGDAAGARAINNSGQIVGWNWDNASEAYHSVMWENGVMKDLGRFDGNDGIVNAINDLGHVAGYSILASGEWRALLWRNLSSEEILQGINEEIDVLLEADVLNQGEAAALTNTLNVATAMLNDGNTTAAVNQLEAFIKQVETMIRRGTLTSEEGQPLIDAAQAVIDSV
jgi:probable HAF family extracellular repeat protein